MMDEVYEIIDSMVSDYEKEMRKESYDALDKSYFKCSINTLQLLKYKLGLLGKCMK